ncbi:hypothetical protein ACFL6T_04005 [Candidatus Zixiibacteriota bacterium]
MRSFFSKVSGGVSLLLSLGLIILLAGCGGGYSTRLTEPASDDSVLIIGSSTIEVIRGMQEAYTAGQEISIMADQEVDGEFVRKAITIWADDEGYFCVENLPPGRYTLKGVRITGSRGGEFTIWNELRMPNERWMAAGATYRYSFTGEYFQFSPRLNVYNFQHNIFSLTGGGTVVYYRMAKMEDNKFHLATTYTRDYVENYFIEKYPDSGWTPILETLVPVRDQDR